MSLLSDVVDRLNTNVPELSGNVGTYADLAALYDQRLRPSRQLTAWVVPGGITGGAQRAMIGRFDQDVTRSVVVVLAWRLSDASGAGRLPDVDATVDSVLAALLGFEPSSASPDARGVFTLRAGDPMIRSGALVYALEFTIEDKAP